MPAERPIFKPKTQEQLNQQVYLVSSALGADIVQPSTAETINGFAADDLATRFPSRWRYYVDILRAQKTGRPERGKIAVGSKRIGVLNKLDTYIQHHEEVPEDRVLRPRQMEALRALRDQMETGRVSYRGHYKLPTRFGKTILFSEMIKAMDVKTMVVVPTLMTGVQAEDALIERVDPAELGRVFGEKRERSKQVTITTYQTLLNDLARKRIDPYEYDLLILDEAHLALTDARKKAVEKFLFATKLGFTATPKYSDEKQLKNFLYPLIYGMSTKEAVEEGILAPFTAYESHVDTGTTLRNVRINAQGDYDERDLAKAVNNERRNNAAVDIYQRKEFNGKKTFVYCAGIDHATAMAEAFSHTGAKVEVISGRNSLEEQEAKRKRLRNGETTILSSADLLITGINEPSVQVVINARPTLSIVMAEQRGGRVLTLDPNNPKKHGAIIDIVDENSNGVLYSDVVSEKVKGLSVKWGEPEQPAKPRDALKKSLEVRTIKVNVRTKEALTVLEDLQKAANTEDEFKQKTRVSVSTLVNLLGKPAGDIAANLPYYYRGKSVRITRFTQDALQALHSYSENFDPEIELPLNVFQEMTVDTVFQRLHGDAIFQELPAMVNGLRNKLSSATIALPEVSSKLAEYDAIIAAVRKGPSTPVEREALLDRSERMLKAFINIKNELSLRARDKESQQIHHELNAGRAALIESRDSEHRVLIRKRARKLMQEEPMLVLDFLNAREDYRGTEFHARIQDVLDPAQVKETMNQACAVVFMNRDVPENSIDFTREVRSTVQELFANLGRYQGDVRQWFQKADVITQAALDAEPTQLEPSVLAGRDSQFALSLQEVSQLISHIGEDDAKAVRKELSRETIGRLNIVRKALAAHTNNVRLFRFGVRRALAENPSLVYSLIEQHGKNTVVNDELVGTIRKNPNFVSLKLRQVQDVPVEIRQAVVEKEDNNPEIIETETEEQDTQEKPNKTSKTNDLAADMLRALGLDKKL